jgi:hypothetical protein
MSWYRATLWDLRPDITFPWSKLLCNWQSVCLGIEHPCGTCDQILLFHGRSYFTTAGQSVSMSWYRAPLWDLRPDITFPRSKLLCNWQSVCLGIEYPCGTCDQILLFHGRSYFATDSQYVLASSTLVGLATRYYFSMVEVTLRPPVSQSVCLGIEHPCGTWDQILLPVAMLLWGVLLYKNAIPTSQETHYASTTEPNLLMLFRGGGKRCLLWGEFTLRLKVSQSWYRAPLWDLRPDITCPRSKLLYDCWSVSQYVLVSRTLWDLRPDITCPRSKLLYDWRSVSQYVLVSSTLVGLATRYYLSKVEVTLRLAVSQSVSQSVCLGFEPTLGLASRY